jgi:hypothetical protein
VRCSAGIAPAGGDAGEPSVFRQHRRANQQKVGCDPERENADNEHKDACDALREQSASGCGSVGVAGAVIEPPDPSQTSSRRWRLSARNPDRVARKTCVDARQTRQSCASSLAVAPAASRTSAFSGSGMSLALVRCPERVRTLKRSLVSCSESRSTRWRSLSKWVPPSMATVRAVRSLI